MNFEILLLVLRVLSALLLLGFVGALGWLIYRDLQATSQAMTQQGQAQGYLLVVHSDEADLATGQRFPLQAVTAIGRAGRNNVVLATSYASSEHALLTWRGNRWWLEDLGSRNGTLLNGVPLTETAVLSNGDTITIGETTLQLEL